MKYTRETIIPFDLCDPSSFIFFGNAFKLCHQTMELFIDHIGIGWKTWFDNSRWSIPIRHAEANFTAPIQAGDNIKINLSVSKLTNSSVTFICQFKKSDSICIETKTTHVFVNKKEKAKGKIPEDIKEKIQRYLV